MNSPRSFTLPPDHRIKKSSCFDEIFRRGKRLRTDHFILVYVPNSLGFPRLGLAIGKRELRSAVQRNRIKRIIREVFRLNRSLFDSLDVIFVGRKCAGDLSYGEAETEIKEALEQIAGI